MKKEKKLVKLLSNPSLKKNDISEIRKLLKEQLNWAEVIGWLYFHRTVGICWRNLKEKILTTENSLSDYHFGYLFYLSENMYKFQVLKAKKQNELNVEIFKLFNANNIDYVVLKGMVLSHFLYKDIGARVSNDCDILIKKSDLNNALDILSQNGYIQGKTNFLTKEIKEVSRREKLIRSLNSHEVFPFTKKVNSNFLDFHRVDIHHSINLMDSKKEDHIVDELLADKITLKDKNLTLSSLNWENVLLFLCIHLYREAISKRDIKKNKDLLLYKIADIKILVETQEINWNYFIEKVLDYNFKKDCYFALQIVNHVYGGIEETVLQQLKSEYTDLDLDTDDFDYSTIQFLDRINERIFDFDRYLTTSNQKGG